MSEIKSAQYAKKSYVRTWKIHLIFENKIAAPVFELISQILSQDLNGKGRVWDRVTYFKKGPKHASFHGF